MRIAFVANTAWYIFNFRLNLILFLKTKGYEIIVIAPFDRYTKFLEKKGIKVHNIKLDQSGINPYNEIKSIYQINLILKKEKINLLISFTPKGNIYSAIACIINKIKFIPGVSGLGRTFIHKSILTIIVFYLYKITFRRAYKVFFENKDDEKMFIDNGLCTKVQAQYVPGAGLDLNKFKPSNNIVIKNNNKLTFILISRMLWDKGIGEFVEAARIIKKLSKFTEFKLLGVIDEKNASGISEKQILKWVEEGVVEYLGETDDVRSYIESSDCVVLPSYREGLPRILLEASAMGCPIITTNVPGCRETLINYKTGFICQAKSVNDLSLMLLNFINLTTLERVNMGNSGRNYVSKKFDENIVFNHYLDSIILSL